MTKDDYKWKAGNWIGAKTTPKAVRGRGLKVERGLWSNIGRRSPTTLILDNFKLGQKFASPHVNLSSFRRVWQSLSLNLRQTLLLPFKIFL